MFSFLLKIETMVHTCSYHSMNPLTGICPTHCTFRGYRHASPNGDRLPSGIEGCHSDVNA